MLYFVFTFLLIQDVAMLSYYFLVDTLLCFIVYRQLLAVYKKLYTFIHSLFRDINNLLQLETALSNLYIQGLVWDLHDTSIQAYNHTSI